MESKKSFSPKEIASLYGITTRALRYRLAPYSVLFKKQKRKRMFTPMEVDFIFSKFGNPLPKGN
jgi:phage antirepressor YoqD-like protein